MDKSTQLIPIELTAVGRVADLGELYDARTDKFLRLKITKSKIPDSAISSREDRNTKLKYTLDNKFEEKFKTLDVSADVQLSVLGGLIKLEGSGRYFKDTKTSARSAKASLIQSFLTTYDQVSITDSVVHPLINEDLLAVIDATHVVVGIQWGGNVIVSVEDTNQEDRDVQNVEGNLGVQIKHIHASLSGEGQVDMSDSDRNAMNKFSFEIYGDLLSDNLPTTLIDAVEFMKKSPSLLQKANNGKGKAMVYTLLSLQSLRNYWKQSGQLNTLNNDIDEATIKRCVKLFDDINSVGQKLNDIVMDVNQYKDYMSDSLVKNINQLKHHYENYQADVRKKLSDVLVQIRSGSEKVVKLDNVIMDALKSEYSWELMETKDLSMFTLEVDFIKMLTKWQIKFLGKNESINRFLLDNFDKDIYIMFFTYDNNIMSDNTLNLFRKMLSNRDAYGPNAMFVAAKYDILQDQCNTITNKTNKISLYHNGILEMDYCKDTGKVGGLSVSQSWPFHELQQHVMSLEQKLIQEITTQNDKIDKQIEVIHKNFTMVNYKFEKEVIPIGFIYTQLPSQSQPNEIWPQFTWTDVTSEYAGYFFRAEGGKSLEFGNKQSDNAPRLNKVSSQTGYKTHKSIETLETGKWSKDIFTGTADAGFNVDYSLGFHISEGEVRPINMAIKLWKRSR